MSGDNVFRLPGNSEPEPEPVQPDPPYVDPFTALVGSISRALVKEFGPDVTVGEALHKLSLMPATTALNALIGGEK